jgi:signal transduction histidine kinase
MLTTEYSANLDDVGKDYATRVGQAATRMDKLLNDLLEYGRVCHVEPIFTRVNLDQELSLTLKKFAGIIHNRKADVEVQRPLPAIWADRYLLELVLTHLLSNALKFVPSDRSPQIRIWPENLNERALRLWFQDNGIGIPVEQHERIFRIFERLQQDKWDQSTGIGLAIVEKAVRRMEGEVGLESTPGNGSRFWVELRLPAVV